MLLVVNKLSEGRGGKIKIDGFLPRSTDADSAHILINHNLKWITTDMVIINFILEHRTTLVTRQTLICKHEIVGYSIDGSWEIKKNNNKYYCSTQKCV